MTMTFNDFYCVNERIYGTTMLLVSNSSLLLATLNNWFS